MSIDGLKLPSCQMCGESDVELGETVRFVKYLPADDPAGGDELAPARPAHALVCLECGTPRGFITRNEKRRLTEGDGE